jgi:hypothetical protein
MMAEPHRLLDTAFVTLSSPGSVGYSFLGLEVTVVICGVLALLHALRERRRGDGAPLFLWGVSFTYGIVMELSSYNFIDSFSHGQFTVMFYHHQLPLYVVTLYPVFQYTSVMIARRLRSGLVARMFLAGLLIVAIDMPFDILGPTQGWWLWSASDPNMAFRWHDVPVTSYYWHLAWGGILAGVTQVFGRYGGDAQKPWRIAALALPLALLTIFFGLLSFLPFHLLKYLGVPDGTIVAGLFAAALAITFLSRKAAPLPAPRDAWLVAIPVMFYACHLVIAVAELARTGAAFRGKMAVIVGVTAAALVAHSRAHRGRVPAPIVDAAADP